MLGGIVVWGDLLQFASPRCCGLRGLAFIAGCCGTYYKVRRLHLVQGAAGSCKMLQLLLQNA